MKTLEGKKVLITSGGTLEKWDRVRGHTNLSKGTMGCFLAETAFSMGAEVDLFTRILCEASET